MKTREEGGEMINLDFFFSKYPFWGYIYENQHIHFLMHSFFS